MKPTFSEAAVVSILLYGMNYLNAIKNTAGEKARGKLHKNAASNIEQVVKVP